VQCDGKEWLKILESHDLKKWVQMKVLEAGECKAHKKEIVSCYIV